jgi:septum formation topological specificity factor MinE
MQTIKKYTTVDTGKITIEAKKADINKIYDSIFQLETNIVRLKKNILSK